MFGPLPKRQKKDDDEKKARQIIQKFCDCTGEDILDYWDCHQNEIVEGLKAHPVELLAVHEKYTLFDTSEQCSVVDVMIRCGVDVDVIKELYELAPPAIEELVKNCNRFTKLFVGFKAVDVEEATTTTSATTCGGSYSTSITAEVLEFLIEQYPTILTTSHKGSLCITEDPHLMIPSCWSLLEFIIRLHDQHFVTPSVIQTVFDATPTNVLVATNANHKDKDSIDSLFAVLVQERCRKPQIMEALVKAMMNYHPHRHPLSIAFCTKVSRRELRQQDVQILSKLIPVVKKVTIPLTYSRGDDNGTTDILKALAANHPQTTNLKELVLELPSRMGSNVNQIQNLSKMIQTVLSSSCNNSMIRGIEKLVLKTRHLSEYLAERYPMDNWMLQLFQELSSSSSESSEQQQPQLSPLPSSLTFLDFSNMEIDGETLDWSAWFRTPHLPKTVAFSGLKITGRRMAQPSANRSIPPPPDATLRGLEFFAEGDRDIVTDILTHHVGSATHLELLSLGFSQRVDVTETVRSLMMVESSASVSDGGHGHDGIQVLDLHANTVLDLPAFADMLRGNRGLRKFHKLQYPKKSLLQQFYDILKTDNTTLNQIVMMPSGYHEMETNVKYYLTLNRFGRQQARDPSLPLETLIGLLCNVAEPSDDNKKKLEPLQRVNTNYGLLRDSIIGTWSLAAANSAATKRAPRVKLSVVFASGNESASLE